MGANTDYFTHVGSPGSATTLGAPGHTIGGTTFNVGSTANWPSTGTAVIFAVDQYTLQTVNGVSTQVRTSGTYSEWEGVVASSTQISNAVLRTGTDQNYPAGTTTRVYIPVASAFLNRQSDGILIQHNQDGTHGAITATSLAATGAVTGASFNTTAANGINQAALPLGSVVQVASTSLSAVQTTTATLPFDDTIPQITEGYEAMTCSITPKATTNNLLVEARILISSTVNNDIAMCLFQDAAVNALAVSWETTGGASFPTTLVLTHVLQAGTTSPTTLRIRVGSSTAGTHTINGQSGLRYFGTAQKSSMTITEIKA